MTKTHEQVLDEMKRQMGQPPRPGRTRTVVVPHEQLKELLNSCGLPVNQDEEPASEDSGSYKPSTRLGADYMERFENSDSEN